MMKLSIAIPTYNRGHRALKTVRELLELPYDADSIEIVVSDNGSDKHTEEYKELFLIDDERLKYYRFDANQGFLINLNEVIYKSSGDYVMLLSDEDSVDPIAFDYYYNQIRLHPEIHIIRPASDIEYASWGHHMDVSSREAIESFFVSGNYMSGTTYDRRILTNKVISKCYKRYKDVRAYLDYPHLFYDALILVHGGYYGDSCVLIHEGESETDDTYDDKMAEVQVQHYGTYERRLEQMEGFVELINDLDTDASNRFLMMRMICMKTSYLIAIVKERYLRAGVDWEHVVEYVITEIKRIARNVILPLDNNDWVVVDSFIDDVVEEHNK